LGDFHAPRDFPDANVVVRGMPPGQVFSGSHGTTVDAAAGVPHGQIRRTTTLQIRSTGGNIEVAPERARSGIPNDKHVDVTEGKSSSGLGTLFVV